MKIQVRKSAQIRKRVHAVVHHLLTHPSPHSLKGNATDDKGQTTLPLPHIAQCDSKSPTFTSRMDL
jgi:hypothetical protein